MFDIQVVSYFYHVFIIKVFGQTLTLASECFLQVTPVTPNLTE